MPPNADMLKALEYIETLRQQTGAAPEDDNRHSPNNDVADVNTEKLRSMLKLTSPEEEEEEEDEGESNTEDKTQEWLKALLSTLEQGEKSPRPAPARNTASQVWAGTGRRPAKLEEDGSQVEGGAYPWEWQQHGSIKPPRKYPLMFEDEGEEGEGEEEERQRSSDRESPFKRTNENVEEKYTPQNLATLQSVFEELGRLANGKAGHKRQAYAEDDEDEEDDNTDDGMLRMRNLDYDEEPAEEDWAPLEKQIRMEEEERGNGKEFDRGLDDDEDVEEEEEEDDDDDESNYPAKRSTQSGPGEDSDDLTKLVDYYLLKVLEKTEEDQQKRELEEEEKRAVRRATQSIDPEAIYQLIRISQNLQIPPDDLLDMLKSGEGIQQERTPQRILAKTHKPNILAKVEDKLNSYQKYKSPPANYYNRQLPEAQARDITEDINTDDILNILGLGSLGNQKATTVKHHKSSPAPAARQGDRTFSHAGVPEEIKDDYGDSVDEDELATYLTGQMLALYPEPIKSKASPKRSSQPFSQKEQPALGTFEQAIQDYFDHMDSDKSKSQKRQSETEDMGGATQTQPLDDEALLKILSFLNPETDESEDKDLNAKSVKGM
ncbi:secretogranin-2-like isoform X1 [Hypomesus transpacificus]|uniref:secretogranin-2-like isoform X1 n=1 Tax=Hypomesus transpacificus TaxID=137520 RepID=UPI001F087901|nr:secretogranin-2-like isoform X1 [Hypomesus transpacificus]